jgi:hypothetical protein
MRLCNLNYPMPCPGYTCKHSGPQCIMDIPHRRADACADFIKTGTFTLPKSVEHGCIAETSGDFGTGSHFLHAGCRQKFFGVTEAVSVVD